MHSLIGLTKLSVWWLSLGIKIDRIEPGKPYRNGAHERMQKDMVRELQSEIAKTAHFYKSYSTNGKSILTDSDFMRP
ncbi:integrase core domain-containing protein [Leptospira mtsangambouensis]|uniref:integrase core domain-containing protein n=1 Tax=Leptospira mtsangambouensis TaxID=2484912 RepID=UPI0039C373E6